MNSLLLDTILGLLLAFTIGHLFYWQVIHPALKGMLRARLARLHLEIAATIVDLEHGNADERRAVRRFQDHCRRLENAFDVDIVDAQECAKRPDIMVQVALDVQMAENCKTVANVVSACGKIFVAVLLINSPLCVPWYLVLFAASHWFARAKEQIVKLQQAALAATFLPSKNLASA